MKKEELVTGIQGLSPAERGEVLTSVIDSLSVIELSELVKSWQDHYGVSAVAAVAAAPAAAAAPAEEAAEEKTTFDVILTGFGEKKIQVIKAVREVTSLGLKEAKELVEGVPKAVKEAISKEEAAELKSKLEEAGGSAEVK